MVSATWYSRTCGLYSVTGTAAHSEPSTALPVSHSSVFFFFTVFKKWAQGIYIPQVTIGRQLLPQLLPTLRPPAHILLRQMILTLDLWDCFPTQIIHEHEINCKICLLTRAAFGCHSNCIKLLNTLCSERFELTNVDRFKLWIPVVRFTSTVNYVKTCRI